MNLFCKVGIRLLYRSTVSGVKASPGDDYVNALYLIALPSEKEQGQAKQPRYAIYVHGRSENGGVSVYAARMQLLKDFGKADVLELKPDDFLCPNRVLVDHNPETLESVLDSNYPELKPVKQ